MGLWIHTFSLMALAIGFLSTARACKYNCNVTTVTNDSSANCTRIFSDVCYEFVDDSLSWFQAGSACEETGGELFKVAERSKESFLQRLRNVTLQANLTWWLGEEVGEEDWSSPTVNDTLRNSSSFLCTYLDPDPVNLVASSDCRRGRGYLCSHGTQSSLEAKDEAYSLGVKKTRFARSVDDEFDDGMSLHVNNIETLLEKADEELLRMETNGMEPTNQNRDNFIKYLLEGTKMITPMYAIGRNDTITHMQRCSHAIWLLSQKKCDLETNPNPKSLFEKVFEIDITIARLLGESTMEPLVLQHAAGVIYQSRHKPNELDNAVFTSDGAVVILPSYAALKAQVEKYPNITAQLATFHKNPHTSNGSLSVSVCSFSLSSGNSDIHLSNLTEMIQVFLPQHNSSELRNQSVEIKDGLPVIITFNITDPSATVVFDIRPHANVSLLLLLAWGAPPNDTRYSSRTVLNQTEGYRWLVTPSVMQQTPGVWFLSAGPTNSTQTPGLVLRVTSFIAKCMHWDVEQEVWSTQGCQVGERSTPELTQCLCNHLTMFGSSFFVMPNHLDLSQTASLFSTVSDNYVVLALLCTFIGLYLATLMWACYADRRALARRKITILEENHPCASYNYLLSIQTGHRKNAGTSSNVTVMLVGTEAESKAQSLVDPEKPVFQRGAVDVFLLASPFPLGEIPTLWLQHDNSGGHSSWYINKVTVQDLQTRQVWHFLCDCWLSADRGDGTTKKTFNAAKKNEIASFRNIFQSRTSSGFRDEHIWVSIVDPPWRSPFTRAQRVSCCMCLLLCTMAINIAFWNIPHDQNSLVLFSIGSLHVTWQEVMVGVESALLMFPINILIITIFRNIKPRLLSEKTTAGEEIKPWVATIPSILQEMEEVVNCLSRSARNKMSIMEGRLEATSDLSLALDRIHEVLLLMQGEMESNPHWVFCSRFVLLCLSRLLLCLERVDIKNFDSAADSQKFFSVTNHLLRKAEMVYTSHKASSPPPLRRPRKISTSCRLPWWFVFLAWFLLLSISGVSAFFTLLYGLKYGKEKSVQWVISLGLSLFHSIFILQPLKVIGVAVFFALLLKPVATEETEEMENMLLEQRDECRRYTGREGDWRG